MYTLATRVDVKSDGSVVGDISTARISIEDGAQFKGRIEIDPTKSHKRCRRLAAVIARLSAKRNEPAPVKQLGMEFCLHPANSLS